MQYLLNRDVAIQVLPEAFSCRRRGRRPSQALRRMADALYPEDAAKRLSEIERQLMTGAVHPSGKSCPYGIIAALCLLPWGVSTAAQASAQPTSRQMEQQRRARAELREELEHSERRIAAAQAEQIRNAQERAEQQSRAQAEADRRREAEQRKEEFLAQARAQTEQSNPPQPQNAVETPQMRLQAAATAPPPTSTLEPLPRRYLLMRQVGLVLMIGASIGALFVLGRIVQQYAAR
jgi:hypothetical protein